MKKRFVSLVLLLALLLGLASVASASGGLSRFQKVRTYTPGLFSDVEEGKWYTDYVKTVYEYGLMQGSNGRFDINGSVTLAETLAVAVRLRDIYYGGTGVFQQGNPWFQVYVFYAVDAGMIAEDQYTDYNRPAARSEYAQILRSAFPAEALEPINRISRIPDVDPGAPYAQAVLTLYNAGILTGVDAQGNFDAGKDVKRSEVATMVARMIDPSLRKSFALEEGPAQDGAPAADPAPANTPAPADIPAETDIPAERQLTVAGKTYYLGMTTDALTARAGTPAEKLAATAGYTYWVFGTETYLDFLLAGVKDGTVVLLVSGGKAFSYMGVTAGNTQAPDGGIATLYTDKNDGGIIHAVSLSDGLADRSAPWSGPSDNASLSEQLSGESIVNFHMTNAFRVYHGLKPFVWDDTAAKAARLHSQDMADRNYFSHYTPEGVDFWERMKAQGITYSYGYFAGENICAGMSSGVEAYNGWVNSAGHRANMLENFEKLGVGAGYNNNSSYYWYMTQDFFTVS